MIQLYSFYISGICYHENCADKYKSTFKAFYTWSVLKAIIPMCYISRSKWTVIFIKQLDFILPYEKIVLAGIYITYL